MSRIGVILLAAALLAGCGGTSKRTVTVSAYGDHPATTVSAPHDPRVCRGDAAQFATQSRAYLAHSGTQAAYPADLWYVILREALADFSARGCDPAILGGALHRALTPKQQGSLVDSLPATMAAVVRAAL